MVGGAADGRRVFVSTLPAGPGERRLALAVVLVSLAIFLIALHLAIAEVVEDRRERLYLIHGPGY